MLRADFIVRITVLLLIMLGITILSSAWLIPFDAVKSRVDALSLKDAVNFFTFSYYNRITLIIKFVGFALLAIGSMLFMLRIRVSRHIEELLISFPGKTRDIFRRLGQLREDRLYVGVLFGIIVLSSLIRLVFLFVPIRYDEAYSFLHYASRPLYILISNYSTPNNHVFHTLLVHIMYHIFGSHVWAFRLPAFIAGTLLVPISYIVGYMFYGKRTALLSACLVASSSILIEYSTNARGYSIISLIFLIIITLGAYISRENNWVAWSLFVICSAIGFYTIPVMLYPFGIVIMWFFLMIIFGQINPLYVSQFIKTIFISCFAVLFVTMILYMPIVIASGIDSLISNKFIQSLSWGGFSNNIGRSLLKPWYQWNRDIPSIISFVLAGGFIASFLSRKKRANHGSLLVLAVIIWCAMLLMIQRVIPYPRVWMFLLPLYFILASAGVDWIITKVEGKIGIKVPYVFILAIFIMLISINMEVLRTQAVKYQGIDTCLDAEEVTVFLQENMGLNDRVIVSLPSSYPLLYYFQLYGLPKKHLLDRSISKGRVFVVVNTLQGQTLKSVIDDWKNSDQWNMDYATMIREYESVILYEIKKEQI